MTGNVYARSIQFQMLCGREFESPRLHMREKPKKKKQKIVVPDLEMKVLDLRDERLKKDFLEALKKYGIPVR